MAYTIPRKYFEKPTRPAPKGAAVNWEQVRKDMGLPEPPEELRNGGAGASPLASAILDPTAPVDVVAVVGGPRNVPGGLGPVKSPDREITGACNAIRLQVEKKVGRTFEQYEVLGYKSQVVNGLNHFVKVRLRGRHGGLLPPHDVFSTDRFSRIQPMDDVFMFGSITALVATF